MIRKVLCNEKGMLTITEVLMVGAVLAVVVGGIFNGLYFEEQRWSSSSREAEAKQNARIALTKIVEEIREAQSPSDIEYGLGVADQLQVQFYADVDEEPGPERIRYYLNGTDLMRGELDPSTTEEPWEYTGTETTEVFARYVRNGGGSPMFRYLDGDSAELSSVPLSLTDCRSVRLIEVELRVDVETADSPDEFALKSEVQLRNLRE